MKPKAKPKAGEVWKVRIFHRTRWVSRTVKLVSVNPFRPGFGWLFHARVGRVHWSESTECRMDAHMKFTERIN